VDVSVDRLEIGQSDLLLQDHLVERDDKEGIQQTAVKNRQTDNASNELEVVQVLRVDVGLRADLKGIVVVGRVLKETIEGVEHLVREKEEELSNERG